MDLKSILIAGLVGGIVAWLYTSVLGFLHRRAVAHMPFPNKDEASSPIQERRLAVTASMKQIFQVCCEVAQSLRKSRLKVVNADEGRIIAMTGITWKSFGERVTITLRACDEHVTEVLVTSTPRLAGTAQDYGRGFENVEQICSSIECKFSTRRERANKGS